VHVVDLQIDKITGTLSKEEPCRSHPGPRIWVYLQTARWRAARPTSTSATYSFAGFCGGPFSAAYACSVLAAPTIPFVCCLAWKGTRIATTEASVAVAMARWDGWQEPSGGGSKNRGCPAMAGDGVRTMGSGPWEAARCNGVAWG
jgi:hypothetical protein